LHFAQGAVFWDCVERFGNEGTPETPHFLGPQNSITVNAQFFKTITQDAHSANVRNRMNSILDLEKDTTATPDFYLLWYLFRFAYTSCSITNEDDRLIALSGIAQDVERAFMGERFVAGLWKMNLLQELCWITFPVGSFESLNRSYRPNNWRAPSWSWASVTTPIMLSALAQGVFPQSAPLVENKAEIRDYIIDQKASGQIKSASIDLRCRLIPVVVHHYHREDGRLAFALTLERTTDRLDKVSIDDPRTAMANAASRRAWLVILRHHPRYYTDSGGWLNYLEGLIVVKCTHQPLNFERIGMFFHKSEKGDANEQVVQDFLEIYEEVRDRIITLV
jgi:hypothetical protein